MRGSGPPANGGTPGDAGVLDAGTSDPEGGGAGAAEVGAPRRKVPVLLALDEHRGKAAFPGLLTGTLSDVAGLAPSPSSCRDCGRWRRRGRAWAPEAHVLWAAALLTAPVFFAVKLWPCATWRSMHGLGLLQWPLRALLALLAGGLLPAAPPPCTACATRPTCSPCARCCSAW